MENDTLKKLQQTELEILLEVDRVCRKNGIRFMLSSGTLLGAVRHKGFIPWDDDIDIMMPLDDYMRFCKIAPKELQKKYVLQTFMTDNFNHYFAKVRKNGTVMLESVSEQYAYHGIWIDIFPIVNVPDTEERCKEKNERSQKLRAQIKKINSTGKWKSLSFDKKILRLFPKRALLRHANAQFYKMFRPAPDCICRYCLGGDEALHPFFPAELFDTFCDVSFEGHTFSAPAQYDKYLTVMYGDYMTPPPPEKRNGGFHTVVRLEFDEA